MCSEKPPNRGKRPGAYHQEVSTPNGVDESYHALPEGGLMPRPRLPWFKMWIGSSRHAKVVSLSDREHRVWTELLEAASEQKVRGRFESYAAAAAIIRRKDTEVRQVAAAGLMDESEDGVWMHDWKEWQRWRPEDAQADDSGTTPDGPVNHTNKTRESHANHSNKTGIEHAKNGVLARAGEDVDVEEEGDIEPETTPKGVMSVSVEMSPGDDRVDEVYEHFKARIQPGSRLNPRKKIASRLKRFSADDLKAGIDHFADDWWWMEHNSDQGAAWFFESDAQSERFLLLKPRLQTNVVPMNGAPRKPVDAPPEVPADSPFLKYRGVTG